LPTVRWWYTFHSQCDEWSFIESERQHDRRQELAVTDRLVDPVWGHRDIQLKWVKGHALVK